MGLFGWKVDILEEPPAKCVIIGAIHTSNFDFIATLMLRYSSGIELNWIGKDSAFRGPMRRVMRALVACL